MVVKVLHFLELSNLNEVYLLCAKSLSHVWLFATPWAGMHQAPLSRGFSRWECWSGSPCPSPGDLPDPGIEPCLVSPLHLQVDSLPLQHHLGNPKWDFGGFKYWNTEMQMSHAKRMKTVPQLLLLSTTMSISSAQFSCSIVSRLFVTNSRVQLFVTPWTAPHQASLSITNSQSPPKPISTESVMPSNHLILCHSLLLAPSIFPSIRVFSKESALCIRWPKYWTFSFRISPSNEHPGLISFRMDWLDLLAVHGTLNSLLQHHSSEASILQCSAFFIVPTLTSIHDYWKNHSLD